ncbi:glycosyltransferase family 2 protein [Allochromatium palmeri]|uniref:Glycosyltransferase n=1 Tax=Allochromatium palmeri TaxID=231048 RepID=A0A6N8EIN4_9GAMM|nr:glycosyltransferase [Allochromatium palmeri]MTW22769.1 glycosyltransferase [Allochromatium palmeri]
MVDNISEKHSSKGHQRWKINVLVRTSERPNYFRDCYNSIRSQTYKNYRIIVSCDNDHTLSYLKEYDDIFVVKVNADNPKNYPALDVSRGKDVPRFPANLYLNELMKHVNEGFIIYLDDDDALQAPESLDTIAKHISCEDDLLFWRVQFPEERLIPEEKYFSRRPVFWHISGIGFAFHFKYIAFAKWDGWAGGDFAVASKLYDAIPSKVYIQEVLTALQRTENWGGRGSKDDKMVSLTKRAAPLFSIVIPTHDRPVLLKRAIHSVLSQSWSDFECIIVDDGSKPGASAVVESFRDDRLIYHRHPRHKGVGGARNTGIRMARGILVCLLDDDDEFLPGILQGFCDLFRRWGGDIDYAWTGIVRVRDTSSGEVVWRRSVWPERFEDREAGLAVAAAIGAGFGLCIRRKCFEKIGGFREDFQVAGDTEFVIRLARDFRFRTVPKILIKIHAHEGVQRTDSRFMLERWNVYKQIMELHWDFIVKHKNVMHAHVKAFAMLCFSVNQKEAGRRIYIDLITRYPNDWIFLADLSCFELYGKDYELWRNEGGVLLQSSRSEST